LIDILSGYTIPGPIISSDNALTFHFVSDGSNVFKGWKAIWETQTVSIDVMETKEGISLNLFPNPTMDQVRIKIDGLEERNESASSKIEIYLNDIQGKLVQIFGTPSTINIDSIMEINLSDTKAGIYFLQLKIDGKNVAGQKLILMAN